MDVLGDFGGFNDALFFFGSLSLASYSSKIYQASIAAELPTKSSKKLKKVKKKEINELYRKINSEDFISLNTEDIKTLKKSIENNNPIQKLQIPLLKVLCYFRICCRKDPYLRV